MPKYLKSKGKGSAIKYIKEVAAAMPVILTTATRKVVITGAKMIADGVTEFNGETVHPNSQYMGDENIPMNHERKMIDLFKQYGAPGVRAYVENVRLWQEANEQKN